MRKICKFCLYGSPDEDGHMPIVHDDECARNDADAEKLFDEGYRTGNHYDGSYEESARTRKRAWRAGWRAGDSAYDSATN